MVGLTYNTFTTSLANMIVVPVNDPAYVTALPNIIDDAEQRLGNRRGVHATANLRVWKHRRRLADENGHTELCRKRGEPRGARIREAKEMLEHADDRALPTARRAEDRHDFLLTGVWCEAIAEPLL